MIKNNIKIAFRNLQKHKTLAYINILGLAVGMAVFFLIIQYVTFELSYDSFNKNANRIYRIQNDRIYSDKHDKSAGCPPAVAPTLKKEFPEVLESARLKETETTFIDTDKKISENIEKVYYADASFLKIFSFPLLKGREVTLLEEPYTVIISNSLSKRLFGNEDPINRVITLAGEYGEQKYKITGVFRDVPINSHVKFHLLISYKTLTSQNKNAEYYWGWNAFNTYILLSPNSDPKALEAKFPAMVEKYKNYEASYKRVYLLQPLKDIHLHSDLRFEPEVNGNIGTVNILSIIAVFVLILAWVNYINLSTCRSLMRAKEVGVRKVLGSNRFQLIKQFLTESFLLNIIAFVLAIIINELALPYFSSLTGKPLSIDLLINKWGLLVTIFITGALLSGIYPAFVLSSFNPAAILMKKMNRAAKIIDLRKGLVIFQFAVSIILIASTIIVYQQVSFMRGGDLGINVDQTMILKAPKINSNAYIKTSGFKNILLSIPNIKDVSVSSSIPGKAYSNASSGVRKFGSNPEDGTQGFFMDVDENYFNLFEVPLLAGRNFTKDSRFNGEIILNEEAVKIYGFKNAEDAINKKLIFDGFDGQSIEIVGVTKNYHQETLRSSILPVIFNPVNASDLNLSRYFSLKINGRDIDQAIAQIRSKWDEIFPNQPFEYEFLDEIYNSQYKSDQRFGEVFGLFTFLAILISCLGLFGLASFTNLQRTKEIGIRKVIGASLRNIILMLIKDFTKWILIANVIAWPVAYYFMDKWLRDFAYRININWWIFVLAGLFTLIIALLTVGYQAIKAALANPVESLKYE